MAQNKLDVRPVTSLAGDGMIGYFSKGHHDPHDFVSAVQEGFDVDDDDEVVHVENVIHEYWRTVKASMDKDFCEDPYANKFIKSESGRGAFPVTHIEIEPWSR